MSTALEHVSVDVAGQDSLKPDTLPAAPNFRQMGYAVERHPCQEDKGDYELGHGPEHVGHPVVGLLREPVAYLDGVPRTVQVQVEVMAGLVVPIFDKKVVKIVQQLASLECTVNTKQEFLSKKYICAS